MSTQLDEQLDEILQTGEPEVAHIVKDPAKVTEAYLNQTPLEALCGHVFTPSKGTTGLPICAMCKELADAFLEGGNSDDIEGVF